MKNKDLAMIIMVIFISGLLSFFVSHLIFAKPQDKIQKAEIVEKIDTNFNQPNNKYFNSNSINPTYQIQINNNNNNQPFSEKR